MALGPVARAQTPVSQFQTVLKTLESIPPYPASASPAKGMFYTAQWGEKWPPLPANTLNLEFWDLGDAYYILDDRGVDYTQRLQESQLMMMESDDQSPPGGGGGSGGGPIWRRSLRLDRSASLRPEPHTRRHPNTPERRDALSE